MKELPAFLKAQKYKGIKFKFLKTQHLLIKVKVNGVAGNFILDTGASNTCIGLESIEKYRLEVRDYESFAASASSTTMHAKMVLGNNCLLHLFFSIYLTSMKPYHNKK